MGKLTIEGKLVDIDDECMEMVIYFNKIGLKSKYCCSGHHKEEFMVMFDDNLKDKQMEDFIMKFSNQWTHSPFIGEFNKWLRKMSGELKYNWIYSASCIDYAKRDLVAFKSMVKN